jgi:ATP-dependent helicase/nuclease subunit B
MMLKVFSTTRKKERLSMSIKAFKIDFGENILDFSAHLIKENINNYQQIIYVTPNKRPLRFLEMMLGAQMSLSCSFYTIDDFVNFLCNQFFGSLKKHTPLERELFFLKLIKEKMPSMYEKLGNENYKVFIWAKRVAALFNDIEKQLIANIQNINYAEAVIPAKEILENLKTLFNLYQDSYSSYTYEGKCKKLISQKPKDKDFMELFSNNLFIFSGFGTLTNSEIELVKNIAAQNQVYFLLQTDLEKRDKLKNISLGSFWIVDELLHELNPTEIEEITKKTKKTEIRFYEFSSKHLEASFLSKETINQLKNYNKKENPFNIAVVLSDNATLFPFLSYLKKDNLPINITMGYPLELSDFSNFIDILLKIIIDVKRRNNNILSDLTHQLLNTETAKFFKEDFGFDIMLHELYKNQQYTIDYTNNPFNSLGRLIEPFVNADNFSSLHQAFYNLYDMIDVKKLETDEFSANTVRIFYQNIVNRFNSLDQDIELDAVFIYHLIKQSIVELLIPFEGHPLKGIQIMGMLEGRMLNFNDIYISDVNEGILPKGDKIDPLMSEDLKKSLGLTSFHKKESLIKYNFFRLIYSARKATLTYTTGATADEKSLRSRFIEQLILLEEAKKSQQIKPNIYIPAVSTKAKIGNIVHNADIEAYINYINSNNKGFSPTEIDEFIRCPYAFYLDRVKKIKKRIDFSEKFEADKVGSIIHKLFEKHFSKYKNSMIDKKLYQKIENSILQDCNNLADVLEKENYNRLDESLNYINSISGFNKKAFELILRYRIEQFFKNTKKDFLPFRVLSTEQKLQSKKLPIYGYTDRIDEIDDVIRVVDYKTGNYALNIKYTKIEKLLKALKDKKSENYELLKKIKDVYPSIQMPIYMIMTEELYKKPVFGEIYHISNSKDKEFIEKFKSDYNEYHTEVVKSALNLMKNFDKIYAIPSDACSFCDFRHLCEFSK